MATLSTHVLDTTLGRPAAGLALSLQHRDAEGEWQPLSAGVTDADGRIPKTTLAPDGLAPGVYQLVFETGPYLLRVHGKSFYPYVPIVFEVVEDQHYHVPLLLSPFAFSTYRGS